MKNYFHLTLADEAGISGDDLNRRHRESRLGFAEPDASWFETDKEIRCIYPGQTITRAALSNREIHVHAFPAYFNPNGMLDDGIEIVDN
jgi:hypothetical protein